MKTWRPSKAKRREFAIKMQDPEFSRLYYERKEKRTERRRNSSRFDYESAGGNYLPTKQQYDFCETNKQLFVSMEAKEACDMVIYGYNEGERIHHDYIHIVNELIRTTKV